MIHQLSILILDFWHRTHRTVIRTGATAMYGTPNHKNLARITTLCHSCTHFGPFAAEVCSGIGDGVCLTQYAFDLSRMKRLTLCCQCC